MRSRVPATLLGALYLLAASPAPAADTAQEVTIPAGKNPLHGCYRTPQGAGPYPVMIFNHGSEKDPAPCGPPDLGDFYQQEGFAFFTFQRHGHGASRGEYIMDLQRQAYLRHPLNVSAAEREAVALQELYNQDVAAAVGWLTRQPWADAQHLAMTGISFGAIQTILAAEKGLGIRAFVAFAPAAQSWNPALAERLTRAVRLARAPLLVIQAHNDYSVEPSRVLGAELDKKGAPNQARVYAAFGTTTQDGHWKFGARRDGIAVWAADVSAFLATTLQ